MSDFIVIFGKDNARIQHGINPVDWENVPNVAINPDLSQVKGIAPHHWKFVDMKVIPAPESERKSPEINKTITKHTVIVDTEAMNPHFDKHFKATNAITARLALVISAAVSLTTATLVSLIVCHWAK